MSEPENDDKIENGSPPDTPTEAPQEPTNSRMINGEPFVGPSDEELFSQGDRDELTRQMANSPRLTPRLNCSDKLRRRIANAGRRFGNRPNIGARNDLVEAIRELEELVVTEEAVADFHESVDAAIKQNILHKRELYNIELKRVEENKRRRVRSTGRNY